MPIGKTARVCGIAEECSQKQRLDSLNIRAGKNIKKITKQPFNGPIVVKIDSTNISLSASIAKYIIIEEATIS